MKQKLTALFAAGAWIGFSEFLRNEILFKALWIEKYRSLGMNFPSEPINNALWGVWSFGFAGVVFAVSRKISFLPSFWILWSAAFPMMWIVLFNLGVLPLNLLIFAVPLSMIETAGALYLCRKTAPLSQEAQ